MAIFSRVTFAAPTGPGWALPSYELALLTASWVAERHLTGTELAIVTPEQEPLAALGPTASRALRDVLADRGIRLHLSSTAERVLPGVLRLTSGNTIETDHVVTLPRLEGPRLAGFPADDLGFIQIDEHARVRGLDDVYAAGDATDFPIKRGGIATLQADAAVEMIAGRYLRPYLAATARTGGRSPSADGAPSPAMTHTTCVATTKRASLR